MKKPRTTAKTKPLNDATAVADRRLWQGHGRKEALQEMRRQTRQMREELNIMQQIDINRFVNQWPDLLATLVPGAEIVLTHADQPVARLVKIEASLPDREPGSAAGLFTMSPDFDEPLDHFDECYQ